MISKHFKIYELVDKDTYTSRGEKAWELISPELIETIDTIKERFPKGSMTINNWKWNGDRNWSGLRNPSSPWFSKYSQHSLGCAIDAIFSEYSADEVRKDIIDNPDIYPHVKGIETDISWLHVDTRNRDTVAIFKP